MVSLVTLGLAILARYRFGLSGRWISIYVTTAVASLYLNMLAAVVQAFQKIPVLKATAPTQSEPPFVITQLAVMALFIVLGIAAARNFGAALRTAGPVAMRARAAGAS
jgi:hypothetical protein